MRSYLFSIITAVRNDAKGFARTWKSIKEQTLRDFEWIVVDGASTDDTPQAIANARADITLLKSEPDKGVYDAMNKGLDMATHDYIVFMNADDRFAEPDTLARLASDIRRQAAPPDFVYGFANEERLDGSIFTKGRRTHRWAWYGMFTHHQAMFYNRRIAEGVRYNLDYKIGSDYDFTLRILNKSHNILRVEYPLCIFAAAGLSGKHAVRGREDQYNIRVRTLGYPRFLASLIYWFQTLRYNQAAMFKSLGKMHR